MQFFNLFPSPIPPPPNTRSAWRALVRVYKFLWHLLQFISLLLQNLGRTLHLMVHKPRRDLNPLEMDGHAKVMCHGKQKYVSTQGNPEI